MPDCTDGCQQCWDLTQEMLMFVGWLAERFLGPVDTFYWLTGWLIGWLWGHRLIYLLVDWNGCLLRQIFALITWCNIIWTMSQRQYALVFLCPSSVVLPQWRITCIYLVLHIPHHCDVITSAISKWHTAIT